MARIQPVTDDNTPADSKPLLESVQKKMGGVPNVLGTLAHAPAALESYLKLSETLSGGNFSASEREVIALAVGEANACGYCLAAHTKIGKGAGLSEDETLLARRGEGSDAKTGALAAFAAKVTATRGNPSDSDLAAFKDAGWTDAHVIEVVAHVAFNTLTNYTNHIAATEVDFPAAPELQNA